MLFKELAIGVGALLLFIVLVQLLYPTQRSLPFASSGNTALGYKTTAEIGSLLQAAFDSSTAHITAEQLKVDTRLSLLGATLDADKTVAQVTYYPWWQRLLPFSIFWSHPKVERLYVSFNDEQLGNAASSLTKKLSAAPKNGTISLSESGEIIIAAAENGVTVTDNGVKKALTEAVYAPGATAVKVTPESVTKPSVTDSTIEAVKAKITTALGRKITLKNSLSGESYTPEKKTIASWIKIGDDLALSLNKDAVTAYVTAAAKAQIIAAGTTKVTMVDGVETGRTQGSTGRGVNGDVLANDLTNALFQAASTAVTINFVTTQPTISYERTYTNSQAALQAYLNDATSGGNIEIAVTQLDGAGWSAASGASKSVVSASTYKLFVSLLLFNKLEAGQIHWTDAIQGTTVETCLYNTIIYSANNCAEQWVSDWGRSWINSALYAKGFSKSTTFTAGDAAHTSAQDLRTLLVGLHNQTLFSAADASRLTGLMKQQVYRSGIPAGSAGTVADKVGFLWDYLNDAAIVSHPRGTYVLVIMTKGESWGKIAEITRQIEKIMYP